jgi:hypothetical protein
MNYDQLHSPAARTEHPQRFEPTMDTLCECGLRYGMHRVNDLACMNPDWRPGNGQPQWLERTWKRA